jgi:hypothetical protein
MDSASAKSGFEAIAGDPPYLTPKSCLGGGANQGFSATSAVRKYRPFTEGRANWSNSELVKFNPRQRSADSSGCLPPIESYHIERRGVGRDFVLYTGSLVADGVG